MSASFYLIASLIPPGRIVPIVSCWLSVVSCFMLVDCCWRLTAGTDLKIVYKSPSKAQNGSQNRSQRVPKWSQMAPKWISKGSQIEIFSNFGHLKMHEKKAGSGQCPPPLFEQSWMPKSSQRIPKGSQNGAKMGPQTDKNQECIEYYFFMHFFIDF